MIYLQEYNRKHMPAAFLLYKKKDYKQMERIGAGWLLCIVVYRGLEDNG